MSLNFREIHWNVARQSLSPCFFLRPQPRPRPANDGTRFPARFPAEFICAQLQADAVDGTPGGPCSENHFPSQVREGIMTAILVRRLLRQCVWVAFLLGIMVAGAEAQSPPTIVKAFSAATVGLNQSVTLTFTLTNPNPATDLTGVGFSDDMPSGLLIANPDSLGGTCDITTVVLSPINISMVGAVLTAGSSCTISVDVLATAAGDQVNTTGAVTSVEGGTGGTATATVSVLVPDLTVAMSHAGNFFSPQTGATYTITVSNAGGADTSALITVNDTLPAGLTATSLSGPNWNCTLSPLQCTRGDVLFAGTSFEDITLTVDVASNAPASLTNTATVSGGAESNTANDTASDPTQTVPALALSSQAASVTITAGNTASVVLNVGANGPGLGAITFACTGLPSAAICSFNPSSVTTTSQVTMSIATASKTTAFLPPSPALPPAALLALAGLALAFLTASWLRSRKKLRFAAGLACVGLLALAGCGVSMSTPVQHTPGTPAGTFAVVVTATSANGATAANTVNLTVQ
jgi:uncharacterized repeat protein (TIGR01451 family)